MSAKTWLVIAIGTKNPGKIEAVRRAVSAYAKLSDAELQGCGAVSGVSDQPRTLEETTLGTAALRPPLATSPWPPTRIRSTAPLTLRQRCLLSLTEDLHNTRPAGPTQRRCFGQEPRIARSALGLL